MRSAGCAGGGPRIRTLATVMNECHDTPAGYLPGQRLEIRRGDCAPLTVVDISTPGPLHGLTNLCSLFADFRLGFLSVGIGVFQRLSVSPDGSLVIFEVTNRHTVAILGSPLPLRPEQEGIFTVRADGSDLRKIAPASREASFRFSLLPEGGISLPAFFPFSPDGRRVVYTDFGPGPHGEDAVQIFSLDVESGERVQLTHLAAAADPDPGTPATGFPFFTDAKTVRFFTVANPDGKHPHGGSFDVALDGSSLTAVQLPSPIAKAGRVLEVFEIIKPGKNLFTFDLGGTAINPPGTIAEVFSLNGDRLLQLTNFRRADTEFEYRSVDGRRAFFHASADPLGSNLTNNCQIFSADALGIGAMRQITHFRETDHSGVGCSWNPGPGCSIGLTHRDPVTGAIVFYTSCDPFGSGFDGAQLFAMRPDGTALRQLTHARGRQRLPDGTLTVELPGPFEYSGIFDRF